MLSTYVLIDILLFSGYSSWIVGINSKTRLGT